MRDQRPNLSRRASGLLLHPTSLPGGQGVGDLGEASHRFVDFLEAAGQSWWQMLPVGPPGLGDSPYQALSVFAGNPALVSLDELRERGLLSARDLRGAPRGKPSRVDFPALAAFREPLLRRAHQAFESDAGARERGLLEKFAKRERAWLDDYALFRALKHAHGGAGWFDWPDELRARKPRAMARARASLADEIRYERFVQHAFDRQWAELRRRCDAQGVALLGDVPIYLAYDSADVWTHPELFQLDARGRPTHVAGVPPDYFSADGQLWGNPLYRWERHKSLGFAWWIARIGSALERFDALRLDHFIAFHRYWAVPARAKTARQGRWRPGPNDALFAALRRVLGSIELVAEDLGCVTEGVAALRDRLGLPGIRVLQFAFGDDGGDLFKPHNYPRRCLVSPGTHDNDTIVGWFNDRGSKASMRSRAQIRAERANTLRYVGTDGREIHWDMIRLALASVADLAVIAVQDVLGLGSAARMNQPGVAHGNWAWRLRPRELDGRIARRLRELTVTYGRLPAQGRRTTSTRRARRRSPP